LNCVGLDRRQKTQQKNSLERIALRIKRAGGIMLKAIARLLPLLLLFYFHPDSAEVANSPADRRAS